MPLQALGYEIIGELEVLGIFNKGKVKENIEVMDKAYQLGQKLAKSIK